MREETWGRGYVGERYEEGDMREETWGNRYEGGGMREGV